MIGASCPILLPQESGFLTGRDTLVRLAGAIGNNKGRHQLFGSMALTPMQRRPNSLAEKALIDGVHNLICQESRWGVLFSEVATRMNEGYYDTSLLACLTQSRFVRPTSVRYNLYDAYCLCYLLDKLATGEIVTCQIMIEDNVADEVSTQIQHILNQLPAPFIGQCHSGLGKPAGHVEWTEEITLSQRIGITSHTCTIVPCKIPLSIGFTSSATTWFHLQYNLGVARLPYGTREMTLFVDAKGLQVDDTAQTIHKIKAA